MEKYLEFAKDVARGAGEITRKYFSGENDGLVSESSFEWGEKYQLLKPVADRGISHGDMIDLNRENIDGFDVREFYVDLVHDLKKRGL